MAIEEEVRARDADAVRWITLDRPQSRNGLTLAVVRRLAELVEQVAADRALRCVVLSGAGGHFCSGADLRAGAADFAGGAAGMDALIRGSYHRLIRAIRAVPKPVIAMVDGAAAGFGCDLALCCDLRLCSDRARFAELFVRRGLMPDGGGPWTLPRLCGTARALELLWTGDEVDARRALELGLVNRVVPADALEAEVAALARRLAEAAPLPIAGIKAHVYASLSSDLDAELDREVTAQVGCLQSRDFMEGLTAFFEKRPPRFTGG